MRTLALFSCLLYIANAIPVEDVPRISAFEGVDSTIIGGSDANPGAWPWQLSQERLGAAFSHSCGSSLLSVRYTLSAAHCVDGAAVSILRVRAGVHDRSDSPSAQTSNLASYRMHEDYNNNAATYANDIAILTLATLINLGAGNVQVATLPPNNLDDFSTVTCMITGWGRTSSSNILPQVLQQAAIGILTNAQCVTQGLGASIWENHICIKDPANNAGACNGDSGGPINCPVGGGTHQVAGIASFVFALGGNCLTSRPSVYTRVSPYLGWITANTPP